MSYPGSCLTYDGFLVYQHTHDTKYLDTSRKMANWFLQNLPADSVVPWSVYSKQMPSDLIVSYHLISINAGTSMHPRIHHDQPTHRQQPSPPPLSWCFTKRKCHRARPMSPVLKPGAMLLSKLVLFRFIFLGLVLMITILQVLNAITTLAWKPEWQSLLANGTVNNPASPPNNLTGIVYGMFFLRGSVFRRSNHSI